MEVGHKVQNEGGSIKYIMKGGGYKVKNREGYKIQNIAQTIILIFDLKQTAEQGSTLT